MFTTDQKIIFAFHGYQRGDLRRRRRGIPAEVLPFIRLTQVWRLIRAQPGLRCLVLSAMIPETNKS